MTCSVLVVTAYSNLRRLRVEVLRQRGYEAVASNNFADAERLISQRSFDVLLLGNDISRKSASTIADLFRARNRQSTILLLGRPAVAEDVVDRVLPDPGPTNVLEALRDLCGATAD